MGRAITRQELKTMLDNKEDITLIDVLDEKYYQEGHIPGAINIPFEQIGKQSQKLFMKERKLVVYCANFQCSASPMASEKLTKLGFENVFDYEGGVKDWKEGGMETTKPGCSKPVC